MTLEELKAKRDALKSAKEKADLENEIKALEGGTVEVKEATTVQQMNVQLAEAAKNLENKDKVLEGITRLQALAERKALETAGESARVGKKFLSKEVVKSFGAEGQKMAGAAEDLAHVLPTLDATAQYTGKPIWELKRFKRMFGDIGQSGFKGMYSMILARHKMMDPSGESDWIPTDLNQSVLMHIMKQKAGLQVCTVFNAPSNPFNWPISTGYGIDAALKDTYGTAVTAGDTGVSKLSFDAKTIQRVVEVAEEYEEDAVESVLSVIMQQLGDALGDALDRNIFFGDTSSANPSLNINDVKAAALTTAGVYQRFNGIVKKVLITDSAANAADVSASAALVQVAKICQLMDKGAAELLNLRLTTNPFGYFAMLQDLLDISKYSNVGSPVSGAIGQMIGIPVFISGGIPKTDANGKVDGDTAGNNVYGSFVINRKDKVLLNLYRAPKSAEELYPVSGKRILGVSARADLKVSETEAAGYGYKVS